MMFFIYIHSLLKILNKKNPWKIALVVLLLPEDCEGDDGSFHEVKRTNEQEAEQGLGLIFSVVSWKGTLSTTQVQELTRAEMCTLGNPQLLGVIMTFGLGT